MQTLNLIASKYHDNYKTKNLPLFVYLHLQITLLIIEYFIENFQNKKKLEKKVKKFLLKNDAKMIKGKKK